MSGTRGLLFITGESATICHDGQEPDLKFLCRGGGGRRTDLSL